MLEKEVEQHLIAAVRKSGGLCLKFVSPGWAGAPDRICLFPGGRVIFVEVKRPNNKPRALQMRRKEQLERKGFRTEVVDSYEAVDDLMRSVGVWGRDPLRKEDRADPGGGGDNEETPSC